MLLSVFIYFIFFACGALASTLFTPCKVSDVSCTVKSVNNALPQIFEGIPDLGIGSSDPMYLDYVRTTGDDDTFQLSIHNTTAVGFKNCTISNMTFDSNMSRIHSNANCRGFQMWGQYEIDGRLIIMDVQGVGDYKFTTGTILVNIENEVEQMQGNDGKTHLFIKSFNVNPSPVTPIRYEFENLFNGQQDLSDAVHRYAEENWLEIAQLIQLPMWNKALGIIVSNINKYLDHVDIHDIIL